MFRNKNGRTVKIFLEEVNSIYDAELKKKPLKN